MPQFHVVFDDWFTSRISTDSDKPFDLMQWAQLSADACYQYVFNDNDPVVLANDWIVASEDNINCSSWVQFQPDDDLPQQRETLIPKTTNSQTPRTTTTSVDPVPQIPLDHPPDVDLPISKLNPTIPFAEEPTTNPSPETSDPSLSSCSSLLGL